MALLIGAVGGATLWNSWQNAGGHSTVDRTDQTDQEVRVSVRRLTDGRIEVGLQQRLPGQHGGHGGHGKDDDEWSDRHLPDARFLPTDAPVNAWRHSSAIVVTPIPTPCSPDLRSLRYVYFAHFAPVSYAAALPDDPSRREQRGYEADLISAIEAMHHTNLTFIRVPTEIWPDIWLASDAADVDLVGGGITILDSRTRNADGQTVVAFTDGHISFRQSLLVRRADAERIAAHDDLRASDIVGAVRATTGEARLLQLIGAADQRGVLTAGTNIETPQGVVTADGSDDYRINAAQTSPALIERTRLIPLGDLPQVVYLGDDEAIYLAALEDGRINAIARGEVGNTEAARIHNNRFVVTALDATRELGGFSLAASDTALRHCLNRRIDWLIDGGAIDYADWAVDHSVFMARAQLWNAQAGVD